MFGEVDILINKKAKSTKTNRSKKKTSANFVAYKYKRALVKLIWIKIADKIKSEIQTIMKRQL